jgi:formylglycine-generating enzyme required for sulfatase activity
MPRPLSIFLTSLVILGMIQLGCRALAQSPKEITNSIGMKLVLIPKGTFMMGSPASEEGRRKDENQHEVTISKDFHLGVYEVTQAQYEKVIGRNPSHFQRARVDNQNADLPVEQVSWDASVEFCKKLSALPEEKKAGRVYRLPTEAEWEYACRAGSKTAYSFGESSKSIGDYGWFNENSGINGDPLKKQTHLVGQKKPNAWGLFDMHGNVFEWCSDWYGDYPNGAVSDPRGPEEGSGRVVRGGSWLLDAGYCMSAKRGSNASSSWYFNFGFRVALSSSENP